MLSLTLVAFAIGAPALGQALFFKRGDSLGDGSSNITDVTHTMNYLFLSGPGIGCLDAADANDDGAVNISDLIYVLNFLFRGGPPEPPPLRMCGPDPTEDSLDCMSYPMCEQPDPEN